jgi:hypothetical protein
VSRFPVAFRPPAFASWSSCSRRGIRPSSRSASHPTGGWTTTGLPRSAHTSYDREGCPLYPGDNGARPGLEIVPSRRLPPHKRQRPCTPAPTFHLPRLWLTRHQRGFTQFTHPVFPSPATARMERAAASAFPRASHPIRPRAEQRTSGWGQAIEHGPGTTLYVINLASKQHRSLMACDLASHRSIHHSLSSLARVPVSWNE